MPAAADALGDAAYRVHYDDYVANPEVLRGLFDWLGETTTRRGSTRSWPRRTPVGASTEADDTCGSRS